MQVKIKQLVQNNRENVILFWATTVAMLLVIVAFGLYSVANGERIRNRNLQYLSNDTRQIADFVEKEIEEGLNNIQVLSQLVSESQNSSVVDISNYQKLINDSMFDFIEFADLKGMDHSITGEITDASDRQYYLDAMKGNSGIEIIHNSRATHETLLMFYSPVYYDGQIVGSLIGVYQASKKMSKILTVNCFGENATAYLCTEDGRVFASSDAIDGNKELSIVEAIGGDEQTSAAITATMWNGEDCDFALQDSKTRGCFVKLPQTGWYLAMIYPAAANERMIGQANAVGLNLLVALLVIFGAFLFIVYWANHSQQRKLQAMLEEIQRVNGEKEKQFEILQSMADVYYSMHLFNLVEDKMLVYKAQNQVKDAAVAYENESAAEIARKIMYATMSNEYLDAGLLFADLTSLAERMKGKKIISADLLGKNVGWIRMSFITIEATEDGVPTLVICTTQIVDEEKKREERLIRESNTDELTGCCNRRAYEDDLAYYPDVPTEENFVYVAMDINGLKIVNDTLGHEAGDELIYGASMCMKQCLGNYGRIYRTGGDEFVAMIFADESVLEDIKKDFAEVTGKWKGNLVNGLSISCGFVTKREFPDMTVVQIARLADQRMYEDKEAYYKRTGAKRRG